MESHFTNAQHVVRVVYMRSYIITLIRRPLGVIRRLGYVLSSPPAILPAGLQNSWFGPPPPLEKPGSPGAKLPLGPRKST